jgi:hypothetical protein
MEKEKQIVYFYYGYRNTGKSRVADVIERWIQSMKAETEPRRDSNKDGNTKQ